MNEKSAIMFCRAIENLAQNPEYLANLENYLSCHFDVWMEKFANTPEGLATEMKHFANMEI